MIAAVAQRHLKSLRSLPRMHELSIAYSLVELASESAAEAGAAHVRAVHIRLGALSGVVKGALEFCYQIAAADTLVAGSTLTVHELPVVIHCTVCRLDVEPASVQRIRCPLCDTPGNDIRQGRELEIDFIEIDLPEQVKENHAYACATDSQGNPQQE